MITKSFIIANILSLWMCINLSCVLAINRNDKQNEPVVNYSNNDNDRDSRQYSQYGSGLTSGYSSGLGGASGYYGGGGGLGGLGGFGGGGAIEAIIIGLLVVFGFGIIGIPFLLLCMNLISGGGIIGGNGGLGGIGGIGGIVPTSTTTVGGRKRRDVNSLLPEVNPFLQNKLFNIFENFIQTPDKIKMIEELIDSVIAHN